MKARTVAMLGARRASRLRAPLLAFAFLACSEKYRLGGSYDDATARGGSSATDTAGKSGDDTRTAGGSGNGGNGGSSNGTAGGSSTGASRGVGGSVGTEGGMVGAAAASSSGGSGTNESGGSPASGASGAAGAQSSGGTSDSGGTINSGGAPNSGGRLNSGGALNSGGSPNSGGALNSGGMSGSGGSFNVGGSQNTLPFTGAVYFWGAISEDRRFIGFDVLQRFWPTRATTYYQGFNDNVTRFGFRPTDNRLFYYATFGGLYVDDSPNQADSIVPTTPCTTADYMSGGAFGMEVGWDAKGTLHYECQLSVYREGGVLVAASAYLAGVLGDGRVIVSRFPQGSAVPEYAVIRPDGSTASVLNPTEEFVDPLGTGKRYWPVESATTIRGNDGFLLMYRHKDDQKEFIVYRVDAQSRWLFVRRVVPSRPVALDSLILSDGTILVQAELTPSDPEDTLSRYVALLPDGSERIFWRGEDSPFVQPRGKQLLIGPTDASGPSAYPELQ